MPAPSRGRALPRRSATALAVAAALAACAPEPVPIVYGEDVCVHCRMAIVDERYGTELVTRTGRVFTFDSIECMAAYVLAMDDTTDVHSLWVTAFDEPGALIALEDAFFLHTPTLKSPMGADLSAFSSARLTPDAAVNAFGGEVLDWAGVLALARAHDPMHGARTPGAAPDTARGHGDSAPPHTGRATGDG